jgi:hypothetical protein
MRNFFYKRNLALILAALVLGHNAQVHAISKKNAVILSVAGGFGVTGLAGYLIYKACGKNKMTEDQLESKIKSVLAEFNIAEKIMQENFLPSVGTQLCSMGIDVNDIKDKITSGKSTEEVVKLILSKITKENIQNLVNVFIPAKLSSRVKLEHIDDNLKKVVDLLLNIEGFKVVITSDVLFNLLVLALTTGMSSTVDEMFKSNEQEEKIFDSDTNTFKFTKKFENEDIKNVNNIISTFKQLNSSEDLVKFLSNFEVPYVDSLGNPVIKQLIELLLKGIKNIDFKLQNSITTSYTWNSDESLTIKVLNGNDVMLQWSIKKA